MDLLFDDDAQAFRTEVRSWLDENVPAQPLPSMDTAEGFEAHRAWEAKMADARMSVVSWPVEYGGRDVPLLHWVIFEEEYYRSGAPGRVSQNGIFLLAPTLFEHASKEQLDKIMPRMARADDIWGQAWSEPESGSDLASLRSTATRTEGGWLLNGQKTWISNAAIASSILLIARTERTDKKHEGITQFHVPAGTPGLKIVPIETLGGREQNDLYFTDCFIPDEYVVGQVNQGWWQLMAGLKTERLILGAMQLGLAQRSFDDTLKFITERKQFGRPVGTFQALRHRMADHATEIECTKLLVYNLAFKADANPTKMYPREASMVKLKATEVSKAMTIDGMQMMGGYSYTKEFDAEHLMRSAIISTVYGGTNEIQRDIIGKTYGL